VIDGEEINILSKELVVDQFQQVSNLEPRVRQAEANRKSQGKRQENRPPILHATLFKL